MPNRRWVRGQGYVEDAGRTPTAAPSQPVQNQTQNPNMGTSLSDFLGGNYENLLKMLGVSGSNPGRPLDRMSQVGLGLRNLQQIAFGNELEPMRQAAYRSFLMNLNPANVQARIDAVMRQNRSAAARNYEQGAAMGINPATLASYFARADQSTAQEGQRMRSPAGLGEAYGSMFGAIGGAQNPQLAQLMSSLQGNMQQSNMMKDQKQNPLGGLLGTVGQLYGMGAFGGKSPNPTGGGNMNWLNNLNFGGLMGGR